MAMVFPAHQIAGLLLALAACVATAGSDQRMVVGGASVVLPTLPGFSVACEESPKFARSIAAMTPQDSKLVTCWVESATWASVLAGKSQSAYPAMFIAHGYSLGGNWTKVEFERLKSLAREKLGDISKDRAAGEAEAKRQSEALARQGTSIRSEGLQRGYAGIFDSSDTTFSYLTHRQYTVTANGVAQQAGETLAITTILTAGNVLTHTVVESGVGEQSAGRAKELALKWLRSYRAGNPRG